MRYGCEVLDVGELPPWIAVSNVTIIGYTDGHFFRESREEVASDIRARLVRELGQRGPVRLMPDQVDHRWGPR